MDQRELRNMFGHFATGVAIVTARSAAGEPVGVTINSFNSVSLSPELLMFGLTRTLRSLSVFEQASSFGINLLAADQRDLSHRFATRGEDKWTRTAVREGRCGAPLLEGALAHIECVPHRLIEAGDHVVFLCRITGFDTTGGSKEPLVFYKGRYCGLEAEAPAPHALPA